MSEDPREYWRPYTDVDGLKHTRRDGWIIEHDGVHVWAESESAAREMLRRILAERTSRGGAA